MEPSIWARYGSSYGFMPSMWALRSSSVFVSSTASLASLSAASLPIEAVSRFPVWDLTCRISVIFVM